ncbi:hypothetical protein [Abyssisolibacter fermentans]|uniref:hypothetical protein n=1 Tax=Abyssisolibacter fermentans TaxID=1766203 RepID=UPI000834BEE0|nr:hypothetical protein [Abyssisolibacter fermentans]
MEVFNLVQGIQIESCNNIVLGHETCANAFISSMGTFNFDKFEQKNIRIVTPMVPQKLIDKIFNIINEIAAKKKIKVVFNDVGLLYMCKNLIDNNKINPVIGRILTHSFFDCPWSSKILECENNDVKSAFNQYFCLDHSKKKLFEEYNVKEFELNYHKGDAAYNLKKNGFKVTTYNFNKLLSVGRICFAARFFQLYYPNCYNENICKRKVHLDVVKKWGKNRIINDEISSLDKAYFKNNYLIGNAVYEEINIGQNTDVDLYDNVILK